MPACHPTGSEHFGREKCLLFQTLRVLDEGGGLLVVKAEQRKDKGRCAEVKGVRYCWKAAQLLRGQLAASSHVPS